MQKITFVIPSRNNLEFLQLAYKSIRNLKNKHEVLVLDDASTDGTAEWITSLIDEDLITYHNPGPERIGIVGMFDKGIEMARTDIIFAFHADMVACKDLDENILKHLQPGVIVSATRVEPPLHPPGSEKITVDFGIEAEDFNFEKWYVESEALKQDRATEGIFAPWCMYKKDFLAVGGHDELFAPQSKEDSDLFNRFVLNGYKVVQSWDGLVYHFTSRGSRFNKHAGGGAGKNSDEWLYTTNKNMRNFIRKWGTPVRHDHMMKPIVAPKYQIGIQVTHCTSDILELLEPYCTHIYIEDEMQVLTSDYIDSEQAKTKFDLSKRIMTTEYNNPHDYDDIVVEIDAKRMTQQDAAYIFMLPEIIQDSGQVGTFRLGNLKITIHHIETYEKNLIKVN